MPISRRAVLTGAAAAAAAGLPALTGCAGATAAPSRSPVRLSFWAWAPGTQQAVDLWNRTHPDVQVEFGNIVSGGAGGYAKMRSAFRAGSPPDLAQIEFQEIPSFLADGSLEDLVPHGANAYRSRFVGWQWQQSVTGNGVYAIPQASGPMGMFYRADLFEKWRIDPPATWTAYAEAAAKIHTDHPGTSITAFPPGNSAWFTSLSWQAGALWFGSSGDTWTVSLLDGPTRTVADYWDRLIRSGAVKVEEDQQTGWFVDLAQDRVVTWIGPQWGDALLIGNVAATSGRWRVAPMPQWNPATPAAANWGGSTTAIFQGTPHPAEALEFAVWLNSNLGSINLLIQGGYGWPSARGAFARTVLDRPSPFFGGQRYNAVFDAADGQINERWRWIPGIDATYSYLNSGLTAALNAGAPLAGALDSAARQTVDNLRGLGLRAVAG
jgi:multiple sugar transport system substrate-binding protein